MAATGIQTNMLLQVDTFCLLLLQKTIIFPQTDTNYKICTLKFDNFCPKYMFTSNIYEHQ